ncbi:leucyl aminopeptidase [Amylibacter kogurei]|uniref:Probable cytosol aminopeptidase n=1 Tax=Paramylibacter kogurei TaxID=1889778 RepID=A0A2G5K5S5_9RHOB|nr:leucyl aminopeptidase [Amylibacter kogurei]PIB24897.1 leucyl aminopeptidase [Amylibacter kogurei]
MSAPITPKFIDVDLEKFGDIKGKIAIALPPSGSMDSAARRVNKLTKGVIKSFVESTRFENLKQGEFIEISAPLGMQVDSVLVLKIDPRTKSEELRKIGADLGKAVGTKPVTLAFLKPFKVAELVFGLTLRRYEFKDHKTDKDKGFGEVTVMSDKHESIADDYSDLSAIAEGVFFTRDLVNEPANVLTTTEFAKRLIDLEKLGVKVKVLEEKDMEKLGMWSLLGVGQGSTSPSKIVIMEWNGGGKEKPFAFVGKGVVFDTGGISLKPAGGMEDMTMDMGGAGVVAGAMKTLALRKAKANVVGLVGLVENMPDALAQRPGDVVKSMKGDTIEVINTDAEGRLVLADVLWYAQKTYKPTGVINLATLTGAIIIGLGHENAGVFSNNDVLAENFLKSASAEAEGAWRMPLGAGYDKLIESRIADIKNVGGRAAGSITAAQFLQRFIEPDMPWIHLDIAGVASVKTETDFAPKGATGWGVRALNRLIADKYEEKPAKPAASAE